jgi:uncharacterized protein
MHRPIHFEIHAPDPAKAIAFYEKAFGWKFSKWNGPTEYWLVDTGSGTGINGGLMRSRDGQSRTVNTVDVADVDESAKVVQAAGGSIVVPKMAIPGVGYLVYLADPGGNLLGMMQHDPAAS